MMRVDMIDLSWTGAQRAIMLEMAGKVTPSHRPMATLLHQKYNYIGTVLWRLLRVLVNARNC